MITYMLYVVGVIAFLVIGGRIIHYIDPLEVEARRLKRIHRDRLANARPITPAHQAMRDKAHRAKLQRAELATPGMSEEAIEKNLWEMMERAGIPREEALRVIANLPAPISHPAQPPKDDICPECGDKFAITDDYVCPKCRVRIDTS